jgi:peptidyl-tRNA hydrolase
MFWIAMYGALNLTKVVLGATEVRELRQTREENARLKRLVADLTLDKHIQEVLRKECPCLGESPTPLMKVVPSPCESRG